MVYRSTARVIVLASVNKISTSPRRVKAGDKMVAVIGPEGSDLVVSVKTEIIEAMRSAVTARFRGVEESDFEELGRQIQAGLEISGSDRVIDVVDKFSTMLEGVLAGKPIIGPRI